MNILAGHSSLVRGLVRKPEQWKWSSYRAYAFGERGPVLVNEHKPAVMKIRPGTAADRVTRAAG